MSSLPAPGTSPRSIEIVTMLGDSVVQVAHCVDPRDGKTSRTTRALFVGGALAIIAAAVAFVTSVGAARDDERAQRQWTKVDHKPAGAFRHHRLGAGYDVVAFGGLALGLCAIGAGLARARRERRAPSFRIGNAPGVDQPIDRDGSFPLVAPGGEDFVLHHGPGITAELIDGNTAHPLRGAPSASVADAFEIAIPSTGRIRARAGTTTFLVSAVARPRASAVPLMTFDRRTATYVAGSLAAHLALLALIQLAPADVGVAGVDYADAQHADPSARIAQPEDPVTPPDEGSSDGGGGESAPQIAMASSGQRGVREALATAARQQVRDNHMQPHLSREEALDQARRSIFGGSEMLDGAIADVAGSARLDSSGLDDLNVYGDSFGGDGARRGFGSGRDGSIYGGAGWGTVAGDGWGTICGPAPSHHCGSDYGAGYGPNGGRGPLGRPHEKLVPTVRVGEPGCGSEGCGPDKDMIRRYIKRHKDKIAYCYDKALLAKPSAAGEITVDFFIMPNGSVKSATATGFDDEVASCVAGVVQQIEFPKLGDGAGVHVHYPFTFRKAGG